MKNVLMIVFFLVCSAYANLQAQSCKPADCVPCPPECCIINCYTSKAGGSSTALNYNLAPDAMFASMSADKKADCLKMTKKEIKACMASCTKAASATKRASSCQVTTACGSQAASDKIVHTASADIRH